MAVASASRPKSRLRGAPPRRLLDPEDVQNEGLAYYLSRKPGMMMRVLSYMPDAKQDIVTRIQEQNADKLAVISGLIIEPAFWMKWPLGLRAGAGRLLGNLDGADFIVDDGRPAGS